MTFASLDAILYINLSHRKDRDLQIQYELKKLDVADEKIHRIEGDFDIFNGHRGCAKSHIFALEYALLHNFETFLILEDDATFIKEGLFIDEMIQNFFSHFKNWDVFFLGGNVMVARETFHENIKQILYSQSCHAYIVHLPYTKILLDCFKKALKLMEEDLDYLESQEKRHSIDHAWKSLQTRDHWFIDTVVAQQRKSYSDITGVIYESFFEDVGASEKTTLLKKRNI